VGGPKFSVSVSVGSTAPAVGWFPLAPREVYVPSYRVSPGYVRNVNVTHVTNITNVNVIVSNPQQAVGQFDYRNRHHRDAVTVVPEAVMKNRLPVGPSAARWRGAPGVRETMALPPQQAALAAPPVAAPSFPDRRGDARIDRGRPRTEVSPPVGFAPAHPGDDRRGDDHRRADERRTVPPQSNEPRHRMPQPQRPGDDTPAHRGHDRNRGDAGVQQMPRSATPQPMPAAPVVRTQPGLQPAPDPRAARPQPAPGFQPATSGFQPAPSGHRSSDERGGDERRGIPRERPGNREQLAR
jgi:hypothetical protein